MAQTMAQLNNLRIAPRKVRSIIKFLKGMSVSEARFKLSHVTRRAKNPFIKLLNSAAANGRNNFSMIEENLFIKEITVNEGAKLKRFKPKGFGQAAPIQKKTSRVRIVLEEKTPGLKFSKTVQPKEQKAEDTKEMPHFKSESKPLRQAPGLRTATAGRQGKPEIKRELGRKSVFGGIKNIGTKLFRRKSV